ncbi:MAG: transporter substrate-binding domain-containing protein [Nitriliruptoraceae bacterium]
MRRSLRAVAVAAALALTLAACGGDDDATDEPTDDTTEDGAEDGAEDEAEDGADDGADEGAADEDAAASLDLVADGALTVCTDAPYEPFEFEDPDAPSGYSGFDIDLMQEIADRNDLELVVVNAGFEGLTSGAEMAAGTCDVAASAITITEERAANVDFTDAYYSAIQSLLVPAGSEISSIDDLAEGVTVGVQSGTTGEAYAEENVPGAEIRAYEGGGALFTALEAGQIDAILQDEPVNANRAEQDENVEVVETYDTGENYGFALAQGRTDALLEVLNSTLEEVREDGFYDELFDRYFSGA